MKKYLLVLTLIFGAPTICDAACRVNYDYRNSGGEEHLHGKEIEALLLRGLRKPCHPNGI